MDLAEHIKATHSLGFVVFELNMQTVFDADLHLDGIVHFWVARQGVDSYVDLLHDVGQPPYDCHPQKISETYISTWKRDRS